MAVFATAAQANVVTINFDNYAKGSLLNTDYAGLGVTFNSTAAVREGDTDGVTSPVNFANGSFNDYKTPLELIFDDFATSISAYNVRNSAFTLSVYDVNGVLLASESATAFAQQVLISGVGNIKMARFTSPSGYGIDDLSFETAVPEPASLALIGLGMLGVAATRRRKSRRHG